MLAIEVVFQAGRFHATPWGRNVNEGVAEWPPSPYRLARGLIDVAKRRFPEWSNERLEAAIAPLAAPCELELPPASTGHTRSFLSSNDRDASKKQKIFDAFVVVERGARVVFCFDAVVSLATRQDLVALASELPYLGRAESWVSARVLDDERDVVVNAFPLIGEPSGDSRRVACVLPPSAYEALDNRPTSKPAGKRQAAVPLSWLDALCFSSTDMLKGGWSDAPALLFVDYALAAPSPSTQRARNPGPVSRPANTARYALRSTVLPRAIETVSVAERVRTHLMGIHRRVKGGDPKQVSSMFSGKGADGKPLEGHRHAFVWPLDEDRDGRIDHVVVTASEPFDHDEQVALDRLVSVWQPDGKPDLEFALTSLATMVELGEAGDAWVSVTPFVTARHHRQGRGLFDDWLHEEVRRECRLHGLPEPVEIERLETTTAAHALRWAEFQRARKDRAPRPGYGFRVRFAQPVTGPFALGALCHFGLGLFAVE